jgi:hydrogenase maturation protease
MATLIIGIGNSLRGDDGVGPALIDQLVLRDLPNCRLMAADVTGLDLIKYFHPDERVIIIDAAEMGVEPGTIRVFSVEDLEQIQFVSATSTHGMGLLETLKLAREVGYEQQIWIIGVQVQTYLYREGLSEKVDRAIPQVIDIIEKLL